MKKKLLPAALLSLALLSGSALAQPRLERMEDGTFTATEGGRLAMQLCSASGVTYDLGAVNVDAGHFMLDWDGMLPDGSEVSGGEYVLRVGLRNFWGEESEPVEFPVTVPGNDAQVAIIGGSDGPTAIFIAGDAPLDLEALDLEALDLSDVHLWDEAAAVEEAPADEEAAAAQEKSAYLLDENGVPVASSFWDMQPDAYDLSNPAHQQAIWNLMMQPITVFDIGQTEHVYPTNTPGASKTPYEQNTAGELHGSSQGVHILEEDTDGDGYLLIEAYSNDGTATKNDYMKSIDNKRISGYVKKSLLKKVTPSSRYALLIDKLRQKLYIFESGSIIGALDVSTGLNNPKQPYNESPAGEYITVSKVGEFVSGTMRANYAIRINGGTLLHEVPYRYGGDGKTKIYSEFEPELGKKASHGCIRIQRRKNAQGQNMAWLWENLEKNTRVFIWDDQGRTIRPEPLDASVPLFRNPDGGTNYHLDENCSGVKSQFLPLAGGFTYGDLVSGEYKKLTPCVYCGAPPRPETMLDRYEAEAAQIGQTVTAEDRAAYLEK